MAARRVWVQGTCAVEAEAATAGAGVGSGVEESVTDGLGGRAAERAGEADALGPYEEVACEEAELHPHFVVDDVVEGQVREAAGFGVSDDVLGAGSLALEQLQSGDVGVGLVGDECGVAHAFDGVEQ